MEKSRRDFLRSVGILGAGIIVPSFWGCGGKINPKKDDCSSPGPGDPTPELTPFQKYNFSVNSPPNEKAIFEVVEKVSDSGGILNFSSSFGSDSFLVSNRFGTEMLSGIKGNCFFDKMSLAKRMVFIEDENKKYFPNFSIPYVGGTKSGGILTMDRLVDGLGIRSTWVKKLDDTLPSWDWEKVDDRPGSIYLGDWTFDEIKNWTSGLEKGSLILSVTAPNPVTVGAYGVLSTAGKVLGGIDDAISIINHFSPGTIDREKRYAWYQPISGVPFVSLFEPAAELLNYREEDIKDFFPSDVGNSWRYKLGNNLYELKIKGLRNVKGKDLFIAQGVDGIEEYFGFSGDKLNHYGFNLSGIGDVFFDPPIVFGDSKIRKGKSYSTNSKIVCENYSDLTGTVQEVFSYGDREMVAPLNEHYGGCFKIREQTDLHLTRGSQVVNDDATTYHWYARNVGRVRSDIEGSRLELYDYDLKNLKEGKGFNQLEKKVSFSGRIGEAIKKLI